MQIRLLLFGPLAEAAGFSSVQIDSPDGMTVGEVLSSVEGLPRDAAFAVAVNTAYAGEDTLLRDGDELALIPPVSGG